MKKIVISFAGLMASFALAPEASAVPSFARQTGMACFACHSQHFPVLNNFGRAFKAGGYTLMGAQGKVEDEHLSIPDTLNASLLFKGRYVKADRTGVTGAGITAAPNTGDGQWQFGDEFSLFLGGRVSENIGFIIEGNMVGGSTTPAVAAAAPTSCVPNAGGAAVPPVAGVCPAGTTGVAAPAGTDAGGVGGNFLAGFKIPFTFNAAAATLSVIPFTTDAHGPMYGYDLSSGGVVRAIRWAEGRAETSAIQYMSTTGGSAGAATGITFVAQNDIGYINLTKFSPSLLPGGNAQAIASTEFRSNYARIAATPTVAGWAMLFGAGSISGSSYSNVTMDEEETRKTFLDFEAHGEVAGKEISVYAQHARAPAASVGKANAYNTNVCTATACNPDRKATTIGVDYTVIPHALSLGAAVRRAQTGAAAGANSDNAITLTAVYDLYQNVALHLNHAKFSGDVRQTAAQEKSRTYLMLEAAF